MSALEHVEGSPYAAGAGLGVLSWFAFGTADHPLGVTSPFEGAAVAIGQRVAPRASGANAFLAAKDDEAPKIDWEWTLVAGVVAGSLASAWWAGDLDRGVVPEAWAERFGPAPLPRLVGAFLGGALMMFGARMAQGCTSGHGISGTMQLAASSWLFTPLMGVTAALAARALYGRAR